MTNEEHALSIAAALFSQGHELIHGYQLSQAMRQAGGKRMAVSTLYRCLDRLEQFGFLESILGAEPGGPPRPAPAPVHPDPRRAGQGRRGDEGLQRIGAPGPMERGVNQLGTEERSSGSTQSRISKPLRALHRVLTHGQEHEEAARIRNQWEAHFVAARADSLVDRRSYVREASARRPCTTSFWRLTQHSTSALSGGRDDQRHRPVRRASWP